MSLQQSLLKPHADRQPRGGMDSKPPNPLSSFLVAPGDTPEIPRSAPSIAPSITHPPDPKPPSIDLQGGGSQPTHCPHSTTTASTLVDVRPHTVAALEGAENPASCKESVAAAVNMKQLGAKLRSEAVPEAEATDVSTKLSGAQQGLNGGTPKHSTPAGLNAEEASRKVAAPAIQELPGSPTLIDPVIQAHAWAILPDLAKDLNITKSLNHQRRPASDCGNKTISQSQWRVLFCWF